MNRYTPIAVYIYFLWLLLIISFFSLYIHIYSLLYTCLSANRMRFVSAINPLFFWNSTLSLLLAVEPHGKTEDKGNDGAVLLSLSKKKKQLFG